MLIGVLCLHGCPAAITVVPFWRLLQFFLSTLAKCSARWTWDWGPH